MKHLATIVLLTLFVAPTLMSQGALRFKVSGTDTGGLMGRAIANAGDVNRDGYDDVIVGMRTYGNPQPITGAIRIFSGKNGSILHQIEGVGVDDNFGRSVAGMGDLNGDGFPDIAVGAHLDDLGGTNNGSVTAYTSQVLPVIHYKSDIASAEINLEWLPDGGDPYALTGTVLGTRATPNSSGLFGTSLAPANFIAFVTRDQTGTWSWHAIDMIEKIIRKCTLQSQDSTAKQDLEFWLTKTPAERLAAVDDLGKQLHGSATRLQRVAIVVQRAQG